MAFVVVNKTVRHEFQTFSRHFRFNRFVIINSFTVSIDFVGICRYFFVRVYFATSYNDPRHFLFIYVYFHLGIYLSEHQRRACYACLRRVFQSCHGRASRDRWQWTSHHITCICFNCLELFWLLFKPGIYTFCILVISLLFFCTHSIFACSIIDLHFITVSFSVSAKSHQRTMRAVNSKKITSDANAANKLMTNKLTNIVMWYRQRSPGIIG